LRSALTKGVEWLPLLSYGLGMAVVGITIRRRAAHAKQNAKTSSVSELRCNVCVSFGTTCTQQVQLSTRLTSRPHER
jgi:hypothetical protein